MGRGVILLLIVIYLKKKCNQQLFSMDGSIFLNSRLFICCIFRFTLKFSALYYAVDHQHPQRTLREKDFEEKTCRLTGDLPIKLDCQEILPEKNANLMDRKDEQR